MKRASPRPARPHNEHRYTLRAELWLYPGKGGWHFLTLPKKAAAAIRERFGTQRRGWGSIPVAVTIGKTRWLTSIFPDGKSGSYVLAVKAAVRKKEKLIEGKAVGFAIETRT